MRKSWGKNLGRLQHFTAFRSPLVRTFIKRFDLKYYAISCPIAFPGKSPYLFQPEQDAHIVQLPCPMD